VEQGSRADAAATHSSVADEAATPAPRERLLAAAADLFSRKGIQAVGVDSIIASARVAKASFYYHFRSKDDLVVAWLQSEYARWLDRAVAETERRATDPEERLLAFFDVVVDFTAEPDFQGCPYLNTAAELRYERGPISDVIVDFTREVRSYLAGLAAAAGLHAPDDVASALFVLIAGAFEGTLAVGDNSVAVAARRTVPTIIASAT
jgi:AcrR family transcriptional regulator